MQESLPVKFPTASLYSGTNFHNFHFPNNYAGSCEVCAKTVYRNARSNNVQIRRSFVVSLDFPFNKRLPLLCARLFSRNYNFLSFKFRSSQGSRNLNRLKELQSRGWIQTFLFIFFYHMFLRNRNSNDVAKQN